MERSLMLLLVSLACAVLFSVGARASEPQTAQVYKGTDSDGTTVYSDRRPDSGTVEKIPVDAAPPVSDPERAQQEVKEVSRELDALAEERRMKRKEKASARKEKKQRTAACDAARKRLAQLESGPPNRRLVVEADGSSRRVGVDEMQRLLEQARQQVQLGCGGQ